METDVELTELEKLEVTRVDGVASPANGFPILLLKALPEVVKGQRDCPECDKSYDADHPGDNCENCGTKLPAVEKAADGKPKCKTCGGTGTIMDGHRDCPDCDAKPAEKSLPGWHPAAVRLATLGAADLGLAPSLLFKAIAADGSVDEQPDIDGGQQAIALIGKLIGYEAQELAAGQAGESADIQTLCCAVDCLRAWVGGEQAVQQGNVIPDLLMQAVKADLSGKKINDLPDSAFAYIEDGGEKDDEGKTTPRSKRHFPIHDKAHADNAAARIAQGARFGDKAKAKVARAQAKFGEDTSKSTVAEEEADVQTDAQGTEALTKSDLEAAVTKAVGPLQERIQALDAELAKVKALPVPGGPMMSAARPSRTTGDGEEWVAKARYYREMADSLSDPQAADGYRQLARQADDKAKQT